MNEMEVEAKKWRKMLETTLPENVILSLEHFDIIVHTNPAVFGQVRLLPKRLCSLTELSDSENESMFKILRALSSTMREFLRAEAVNFFADSQVHSGKFLVEVAPRKTGDLPNDFIYEYFGNRKKSTTFLTSEEVNLLVSKLSTPLSILLK